MGTKQKFASFSVSSRLRRLGIAVVLALVFLVVLDRLARSEESSAEPIDPVLVPAWEMLVQIVTPYGRPLGMELASIRVQTDTRLVVGPVPLDGFAQYRPNVHAIVVSEALVGEDPRALAAVLAHEQQHVKQGQQGLLKIRDCAMLEAWAYGFQSDVWEVLTERTLPTRRPLETELTRAAEINRSGGVIALYRVLAAEPRALTYCATIEQS